MPRFGVGIGTSRRKRGIGEVYTGAVADLEADMDGNDVVLSYTPLPDTDAVQYRWNHADPPVLGAWKNLDLLGSDDELPGTPDTIYFQIRLHHVTLGWGPPSNSDPVTLTDIQAPQVTALFPANGATATQRHMVRLTFDEALVAGTGVIGVYDSDDDLIEEFDIVADAGPGVGQVEISGTTITCRLTSLLEASKGHYVLMDEGVAEDAAGNPVDGIAGNTDWAFTTDAAPTTVSLLTSVISTTDKITVPATVDEGDLLVLCGVSLNAASAAPGPETPAGFDAESVHNASTGAWFARGQITRKVCIGGEANVELTGMNGDTDRKILLVFRADRKISRARRPNAAQSQFTGSAPTNQVVPSALAVVPAIILALYHTLSGSIASRGMTPAKTAEVNNTTNTYVAYKIYNAADTPADVTVSTGDNGNNHMASNFLEIS
jgi:hypothetical protein